MVSNISLNQIKKLRDNTGAGVMDAKRALQETGGNFEQAIEVLKEQGLARIKKRADRETAQGLIVSYVHTGGRSGVLLEINCETDFVARTDEFKKLCFEIAMQIAAMNPVDIEVLLVQEYIRDSGKKIEELVEDLIAKTGENIVVRRFMRYELGEEV